VSVADGWIHFCGDLSYAWSGEGRWIAGGCAILTAAVGSEMRSCLGDRSSSCRLWDVPGFK
jgi:hypothetical protein